MGFNIKYIDNFNITDLYNDIMIQNPLYNNYY